MMESRFIQVLIVLTATVIFVYLAWLKAYYGGV